MVANAPFLFFSSGGGVKHCIENDWLMNFLQLLSCIYLRDRLVLFFSGTNCFDAAFSFLSLLSSSVIAQHQTNRPQISDAVFDCKRTSKQCRARYMNHLDPDLRHDPWTFVENAALKLAVDAYGDRQIKWASIVKDVPELRGETKMEWSVLTEQEQCWCRSLHSCSIGLVDFRFVCFFEECFLLGTFFFFFRLNISAQQKQTCANWARAMLMSFTVQLYFWTFRFSFFFFFKDLLLLRFYPFFF